MSWSTPTGVFPRPTSHRVGVAAAVLSLALVLLASGACSPGGPVTLSSAEASGGPSPSHGGLSAARLRYVALGDSFTIGTSVTVAERWPDQLVARLPALELVANLGVNGFTSRDVIEVELPQLRALRPDLLTLLIGVNDVVQGVPEATYRQNAAQILDVLVALVGARRVLVVTTPDYTVTPRGADYGNPAQQAAAIRASNAILTAAARDRGIGVVDVYDLSIRAETARSLEWIADRFGRLGGRLR